jgi:hypothetical protein
MRARVARLEPVPPANNYLTDEDQADQYALCHAALHLKGLRRMAPEDQERIGEMLSAARTRLIGAGRARLAAKRAAPIMSADSDETDFKAPILSGPTVFTLPEPTILGLGSFFALAVLWGVACLALGYMLGQLWRL